MGGQVPGVARVKLLTLTPLHIGAAQGGGRAFEDECLGRPVPSEYRAPGRRYGPPDVVRLYRSWRDREGTPYIPGSTLRGLLRTLYTGALEAGGVPRAEDKAAMVFGSTEQAGTVAVEDLLPEGPVSVVEDQLVRYAAATQAAGGQLGGSARELTAKLVESDAEFTGSIVFAGDELREVLRLIFSQRAALVAYLCSGSGTPSQANPERAIPRSRIHQSLTMKQIENKLFTCTGNRWTIKWKLGRFAKSYAKALSKSRRLAGGTPHAYYLVDDEVPGWVSITFDVGSPRVHFQLNEWSTEVEG